MESSSPGGYTTARHKINPPGGDTSKQLRQGLDFVKRMRLGAVIRHAETVIDMLLDHVTFCGNDAFFDRQQLLCGLKTWLSFFQHFYDMPQMAFGALEPLDGFGVDDVSVSM